MFLKTCVCPHTKVVMETLVGLGAKVRWCSCNIYSAQVGAHSSSLLHSNYEPFHKNCLSWRNCRLAEFLATKIENPL